MLFSVFLDQFEMLGFGLGLFFRALVFLAVVEDLLYEHYVALPVDLTLLWVAAFLPLAFAVDATFWVVTILAFFHRVFVANPRPLAAFIFRHLPILEGIRFCRRWLLSL
ncbi:hypothetical protein F5Y06DRAFT_100449 [Hypoxylon sp. FL0890]|nr:hypothetical protein F5Y06DRAFT_100449 [Hypoxylon sp. FL0890]